MTMHSHRDTPLAIIGMACRLPGADDLESFWTLVRTGGCALAELPPERFDQGLYYQPEKGIPGKSYSRLGGVVPDRPFRRDLCPVSEELLASADIAHLDLLEVAAMACHHARLDPLALPVRNTGVFIGHARGSMLAGDMVYATHIEELGQYLDEVAPGLPEGLRASVERELVRRVRASTPHRGPGGKPDIVPGAIAGLVSEAFGLSGPCMAVDAACASSFYALALAAQALRSNRIEMAIVGGASYGGWQSMILFSHAQALSAHGSSPFDSRADGFVSADGYAAILAKTLPRALADGDTIHGVIRGIGFSTDGHGKSLWAPRKEGQIAAIRRAYGGDLEPGRMQYMEAHGTSTQLGDSTEVEALSEVLGPSPGLRIPIGSVKANIGHTRETAGLAGLIKTLLAMQHGCVPPAAGFESPNPHIDWDRIPFFVPARELEWPRDGNGRRCAAVDAFGIGGLNVHVVVDQDDGEPRAVSSATGRAAAPVHVTAVDAGQAVAEDAAAAIVAANDAGAVAIVGIGAIFAGARDAAAFRELVCSGVDARREVPANRWSAALFCAPGARGPWRSPIAFGGFITDFEYDWRAHKIPPRQIETADPLQFMLLDAADQALADAGYRDRPFDRHRTGVVVGTMFIGDFATQLNLVLHLPELERTVLDELCTQGLSQAQARDIAAAMCAAISRDRPMLRDETGSYTSSTLASRIAKSLDLMGGACAVDAGEASSMAALSTAVAWLSSGACDVVLCAGAQRAMDISMYETASLRNHLARGAPRPAFDRDACGLVPGEGVGSFVLERLADARRDGDRIRAIIRGIGVASDAGAPADALRRAVASALGQAHVPAHRVAAVAAVGTAVPELDIMELDALAASYGRAESDRALYVSATAGQIGHCFGAAGSASLLRTVFALEDRVLPAGQAPEQPIRSSLEGARHIEVVTSATPLQSDREPLLAGVNAFSMRGLCYHVLIEPGGAPPDAAPTARMELAEVAWCTLRLGASDLAELGQRVARKAGDDGRSLFAAAQASRCSRQDRARLVIVAHGPDELAEKVHLAARQMLAPEARRALADRGIFIHSSNIHQPGQDRPRIAFLFPGQGSQYAGMLRELVALVPAAAAKREEIDACMARQGHPSFARLAWEQTEGLGMDVWLTQLSVLLADVIALAAVTDLGIRPDVISAHSYGEYPALVAAGVWTLDTAVQVTRARCQAIEASERTQGALWSTTAPLAEIEQRMAGREAVWIANHNAPDQSVIGGAAGAVQALASELEAGGFPTARLPVPRPFHTPLMADVQGPLRDVLDAARMYPARTPVLSSVTGRYVADPIDIRANLVAQMTEPVRYVDQIRRLVEDGVRVLVEIGPRQVLTQLHRRILGDEEAICVSVDSSRHPGLEQLLRVRAALEAAGIPDGEAGEAGSRELARAVDAEVSLAPIIHFDAMQRRKGKLRQPAHAVPAAVAPSVAPAVAPATQEAGELERFLIQFVCEHTGYPAELVDLDMDLEADLGIDSIKKAQLLGELREHFDIRLEPGSKLTLADFSTLRHMADFLRQRQAESATPACGPMVAAEPAHEQQVYPASPSGSAQCLPEAEPEAEPEPAHEAEPEPAPGPSLVRCAGGAYEMGAQHARALGKEIRFTLEQYCALLGRRLDAVEENLRAFQAVTSTPEAHFTPDALDEMRGIADVLGLPGAYLHALNLGLYPASGGGCAQFAVTARQNGGAGMLHGVNEDWPLALKLPVGLTRIVQVRHPASGIPHLYFSVAGQCGGLNGVNACGVAVSSTMLLDCEHDNRTILGGKIHPVLVQTILERASDIDSAVDIVRETQKLGAWSLCVSHHPTDEICYLEYDGDASKISRGQAVLASTNHALLHTPRTKVPEHSRHRRNRLQHLIRLNGGASLTLAEARNALRDRFDWQRGRETAHATMNTVRRVDNQISVVMRPALGEVWCTLGPRPGADPDQYHRLDVGELLGPSAGVSRSGHARVPAAADGAFQPPDRPGHVMSRFVLRMVDAPLEVHAARALRLGGPALILGRNAVARALRALLEERGASVLELPAGLAPDQAPAVLEQMWQAGPIPHLFLLTPWDEGARFDPDPERWARRRQEGVVLPYLVCQQWARQLSQSALDCAATLVAATSLGGDFGFSSRVSVVEGGALAGLLKAVRREIQGILVKVVDMPPESAPARVAATIHAELASGSPVLEVGYVHGRRRVVSAVARPAATLEDARVPRGGTWIVTGGARGITARVACELGRRFGWKLHLIGTSPLPRQVDGSASAPVDRLSVAERKQWKAAVTREAREQGRDPVAAWREAEKAAEIRASLQAFAGAGVAATYHACDVSDRAALARVVAEIRASSGAIQGILHGAGVEAAARFERKELHVVEATIAAKVDGAIALMAALRDDPAPFFIGFGSISGRFGGLGQTDYSLASEMLCKLVQWFRAQRPDGAAVTIHWPAWDEVGMAMRPESKLALDMGGQSFMPPSEGIEHLCDELAGRAPEGEVLFLGRAGALDLDGTLPAPAVREQFLRRGHALARLPLVDGLRRLEEGRELVAEMRLHPVRDPFLNEHRLHGVPLLPAVIGVEAIAEAASLFAGDATVVMLRQVEIAAGMRFFTDRPQEARVQVVKHGDSLHCQLVSDFHNRSGELIEIGRVHASAMVELGPRLPVLAVPEAAPAAMPVAVLDATPNAAPAPTTWYEMRYRDEATALEEGLVFHGPSLRCLRRVSLHATGGWGEIVAPPVAELGGVRAQGWLVPAAVLDACLVTCGVFAYQVLGLRQLPHAFDAIRLGRLPRAGECCKVRVRYRGRDQHRTHFDFVLLGADDTPLLVVEGHHCILLVEAQATLDARS